MNSTYYPSPLGLIRINTSAEGLCSVMFIDEQPHGQAADTGRADETGRSTARQLAEYFAGQRKSFDLPLAPQGSPFQRQVWDMLLNIPYGSTDSYAGIAGKLNHPLSVRAVGAANGRNPIAVIIPCHRVIGSDGKLTGYAGGLWRKEHLLQLEGAGQSKQQKLW